jgi:hypothetical protein
MRSSYLDVKDMDELRASDPAAWPGDIPPSEFEARGEALLAVAGRMNRLLADYGKAKTRYGNLAERRAMQSALLDLERARDAYSRVTGQGFDEPTTAQEAETRRLAKKVLKQIVAREVAERFKDEGLTTAVLTSKSLKQFTLKTRALVEARLRRELDAVVKDATNGWVAIGAAGPPIVHIRRQLEAAADRQVDKLLFRINPKLAIVNLVLGKRVQRTVKATIRRLVGPSLTARARRSTAGMNRKAAQFRAIARKLGPNAKLATVRRQVTAAERTVARSRFLEADLKKARRTRLLREHVAARKRYERSIRVLRARFLLGSSLQDPETRAFLRYRKEVLEGQIGQVLERYRAAAPAPAPAPAPQTPSGGCTVALELQSGKAGVRGTATLDIRDNPATERATDVYLTASMTGADGGTGAFDPVIYKVWGENPKSTFPPNVIAIGRGDWLDFAEDQAAGRTTPDVVEGMWVNLDGATLIANSPLFVRLVLTARDLDSGGNDIGVPTEIGGECRVG